jgi:hypothetical protein
MDGPVDEWMDQWMDIRKTMCFLPSIMALKHGKECDIDDYIRGHSLWIMMHNDK